MRNNLTRRLVDLEANWVDTTGARKLDLGWLTKEERGRLRTILLRVKDDIFRAMTVARVE